MAVAKSEEDFSQNFQYWNTFSVSHWYPALQQYTFKTKFIKLSVDQAEAFVRFQEKLLAQYIEEVNTNVMLPFPDYDDPLLQQLEDTLDELVKPLVAQTGGAFVKMSDRSPKDSATERGRIQQHLSQPLQRISSQYQQRQRSRSVSGASGNGGNDTNSNNNNNNHVGNDIQQQSEIPVKLHESVYHSTQYCLPAVYEAFTKAMKVVSGKDAMQLLLVSFRTLEDVKMRLKYKNILWDLEIVVREWCDFDQAMEFRGFVCNGKLNALSQYFYDCYFPVLKHNKQLIGDSIQAYWQTLQHTVPYDAYVIDFCILPNNVLDHSSYGSNNSSNGNNITSNHSSDGDNNDQRPLLPVRVIELNPFDEYTDGALFNWKIDKSVICDGPFKFRITDHAVIQKRPTWWTKIITDYLKSQ